MKLAQRILIIVAFILSLWNFSNVNDVFAEEVEFSGVTAPIGVNVRDNKNLTGNIIDVLQGNQTV
ncbi:hypothetical protein [Bacillus paranthracis]|nr:hypothetical protein [Bacillus paranthracis]